MKKTNQIHIGKTLFTIEEDAYAALEAYLASVKAHFSGFEGKQEIISDIESRIAEQFLESKEQVISLPLVERVTSDMGNVGEFDDGQEVAPTSTPAPRKRLYRDAQDGLIAGVASGLAAYFGMPVLAMRLVFVVLAFFNGLGILIYVILWIAVPEARTASQRLEMAGEPVTLANLREGVTDRLEDTSARRVRTAIARAITLILKVIIIAVGIGLICFAIGGIVGMLVLSGFLVSNTAWLTTEVPMQVLLPGAEYGLILAAGIVAGLIPLLAMLAGGLSLLRVRFALSLRVSLRVSLALLGIWLVAVAVCGFGLAESIHHYQRYIDQAPAFQETSYVLPLDGRFTAVKVEDDVNLAIVSSTSTTPTLIESGRAKDMGAYAAHVEHGVLIITAVPVSHIHCLLCEGGRSKLTLNIPSVSAIEAQDSASVHSDDLPAASSFALTLADDADANLRINGNAVSVSANGARANLTGTAHTLTIDAKSGAYVDTSGLDVASATVTATDDSTVRVQASGSMKATARTGSTIIHSGTAIPTVDADGESAVKSPHDE